MYIGPWQELRLGQLLNDHKRLMEQSVHQQLQIIKQQQLIQAMNEQQQQQQLQQQSQMQITQQHAAQVHTRPLPLSSLPSVLSTHSPRSHLHSHHSYVPPLVRDLSTASTVSNASSTVLPSSLVHYHHTQDPYPLPPLPPISRASPPSSRRRVAESGEQRKKKSSRTTAEQVAAERREQLEKMRVVYGLSANKQEEHKEQERDSLDEPFVDGDATICPIQQRQQQRVPVILPQAQRSASSEVLVISAEHNHTESIRLPDEIADFLLSTAHPSKPLHTTTGALPELSTANLFPSSRSRTSTTSSMTSFDDTSGTETSDTSDRSSSPPNDTVASHRATVPATTSPAHTASVDSNPEQQSLPPLPLSGIAHPTQLSSQLPATVAPPIAQPLAAPTPSPAHSLPVFQRTMSTPMPPRMSEDEYLRGMAVYKRQPRQSLEGDAEEGEAGAAMGELKEQVNSSWAAHYEIVVRPKTALLLTQLSSPPTLSTSQRGPMQLSASTPSSLRSLGLGAPVAPLVNAEVNDSRLLLQPVEPFIPNGSRPRTPSHEQQVDASTATTAAAGPTSSQPPASATATAPRSLSLFARHSISDSWPSASPPARPSMETTLLARRSVQLEPLVLADGRERRGSSADDELHEVSTAMLEEETEKLLSFVQTASESVDKEEADYTND